MDDLVQATLDWCNKLRADQGKPPLDDLPKGRLADMATCPCGAATGYEVGYSYYYENVVNDDTQLRDRRYLGEVPGATVYRFIKKFDAGKYPQYIDDADKEAFDVNHH